MNVSARCMILVLLLSGCTAVPLGETSPHGSLPPRLDSYFAEYCDYTGGMGIGFDPEHTWDYRFRRRLKTTADPEIKRLFVLRHLYLEVKSDLRDFRAGTVRTGKASYRPITLGEWQKTREDIQRKIGDLTTYVSLTNFMSQSFDPLDSPESNSDSAWIQELSDDLRTISNAPPASESSAPK